MRLSPAIIPAALLALAIAAGASAGPREPTLARIGADGPVALVSDHAGLALLQADRIKPGDSVSGTLSLSNGGEESGTLDLGVSAPDDRPGSRGGLLSSVLRLRVEDLSGGRPPLETGLDRASTLSLGELRGGETRAYRVTAVFPDTGLPAGAFVGDNLQQGSSTEVALQWQLTAADPPAATATPAPAAPAAPVATPAPAPVAPAPRAAVIRLRIPHQRVLQPGGLAIRAECEVACSVRFTAETDTAPRGGKRRRILQRKGVLRGDRRRHALRAGREQRLFLKLRPAARRRIVRRLRRSGRVGVTVVAHVRSTAGEQTARRRIVMRTYLRGDRHVYAPITGG